MSRRAPRAPVLMLALGLAGCSGGPSFLASAPTPTPLPVVPAQTPVVPTGGWSLTTTLTSATDPKSCAVELSHMHVGESYGAWLLTIERSGQSINLVVSDLRDPTDRYEYEGTVVGGLLAARSKNAAAAGWCGGVGRVTFSGDSHLSGRFSEDGHTLTAEVVDSIRLDSSGDVVGLHYHWTAVQH